MITNHDITQFLLQQTYWHEFGFFVPRRIFRYDLSQEKSNSATVSIASSENGVMS